MDRQTSVVFSRTLLYVKNAFPPVRQTSGERDSTYQRRRLSSSSIFTSRLHKLLQPFASPSPPSFLASCAFDADVLAARWSCFSGPVVLVDNGFSYVVFVAVLFDVIVGIVALIVVDESSVKNAEVLVGLTLWLIVRRISGDCVPDAVLVVRRLKREAWERASDC